MTHLKTARSRKARSPLAHITLLKPAHDAGPHVNGFDNCHARVSTGGMCPGCATSDWLNRLGPDATPYSGGIKKTPDGSRLLTNLDVRLNWLNDPSGHIMLASKPRFKPVTIHLEVDNSGRVLTNPHVIGLHNRNGEAIAQLDM